MIFSTFHMKFFAKKIQTNQKQQNPQTNKPFKTLCKQQPLKYVGHFTFQGVKSWFDSFRQRCKK